MSKITGISFRAPENAKLTAKEEALLESHIDAISKVMAKVGLKSIEFLCTKPPKGGRVTLTKPE
jgi:hypothetical protein